MRRTEYRVPAKAPEVRAPDAARAALRRDVTVQTKRRSADRQGQCKNNYGGLGSAVQRSGLNFFCWSYDRAPGRSETGAYSKPGLHKNKCFF